ncbi:hypothetical protein [Streptomyces sp. NPDC006270]|uniref:hypothetical protein n=1 Tax=Streptomyces sp. NPDC006270 TaxID=3364741 RepID=UPI0036B9EF55
MTTNRESDLPLIPALPPLERAEGPVATPAARPLDIPEETIGSPVEPEHELCDRSDCELCASPVDGLVQTAATARSLDEVLALIRLLEQTPDGEEAAGEAVRTAAVERPVDEVAELVARLSEPPQPVERADQAIHAAAARRPISEISHLMALLHRPPHDQHAGEEAVHAAATGLTVEELVELISRLQAERTTTAEPVPDSAAGTTDARGVFSESEGRPTDSAHEAPTPAFTADLRYAEGVPVDTAPERSPRPAPPRKQSASPQEPRVAHAATSPSLWLRWVTAAVLLLCGAAHFPLQLDESSTTEVALAVGVSGLCVLLAAGMLLRLVVPVLALGVLYTGLLAAAHLVIAKTSSSTLATVLDGGGVLAPLSAVLAALVCLLALSITLTRDRTSNDESNRSTTRTAVPSRRDRA